MIRCWRHDFGSEKWVKGVSNKNTAVHPQAKNYVSIAWRMGELRWTLRAYQEFVATRLARSGEKPCDVWAKQLWKKEPGWSKQLPQPCFFLIPGFCWDNPDGCKLPKVSLHPSMISMECRPFETSFTCMHCTARCLFCYGCPGFVQAGSFDISHTFSYMLIGIESFIRHWRHEIQYRKCTTLEQVECTVT